MKMFQTVSVFTASRMLCENLKCPVIFYLIRDAFKILV